MSLCLRQQNLCGLCCEQCACTEGDDPLTPSPPSLEVPGLVPSPAVTRDAHGLIRKVWEWVTYLPGCQGGNDGLRFPEAQCRVTEKLFLMAAVAFKRQSIIAIF